MYADRLAVIHPTTPTITVELFGAAYPAIRLDQGNTGSPLFFGQGIYRSDGVAGWIDAGMFSNFPVVMQDSNPTLEAALGQYDVHGGVYVYGYSAGDYAIRSAGDVLADYGGYFVSNGVNSGLSSFIDGYYFGYRPITFDVVMWPDPDYGDGDTFWIETSVQDFGTSFTGGTASPDALNSVVVSEVDPGFGVAAGLINGHASYFVSPTLASTTSSPEVLVWYQPQFDGSGTQPAGILSDRVLGFKIGSDGLSNGSALMFQCDSNPENCEGIWAVCLGAGEYHVLREMNGGLTPVHQSAYTECDGAGAYTNYRAGFNHADLPTYLHDIIYGGLATYDANYSFTSLQGTDAGFLLSYKKLNGATWEPKYILVSKDWATFQFIVPSAQNVIAEEVVTQSEGGDNIASQVNMFLKDDVYYLIGGTTEIPKVLTSEAAAGPGVTDEDIRLRVWGYQLDGHAHAVFRLGVTESLVLDLTTGQWAWWASPDLDYWRVHVGQNWVGMSATTVANGFGSDVVCGDDTNGNLYILDPDAGRDDDPDTGTPTVFTRKVTAGIPLSGREVAPCGAVTMGMTLGEPTHTGATISLRTSDDNGRSWQAHGTITVTAGNYSDVVEWRALGLMRSPGRIFEFSDNGATVRIAWADMR